LDFREGGLSNISEYDSNYFAAQVYAALMFKVGMPAARRQAERIIRKLLKSKLRLAFLEKCVTV
jgi:hypothetical protein